MALLKAKEDVHRIIWEYSFSTLGYYSDADVYKAAPSVSSQMSHVETITNTTTPPQTATATSGARAGPPVLQRLSSSLLASSQVLLDYRHKNVPPAMKELMWHCKMSFAVCCFVWPIADTSTFCHLANFVLPSYSFRPVVWKRRHLIVNRALYRVIVYDFPWLLRCCSNYSWLSKWFLLKIIPFIYLLMSLFLLSCTPLFS